MTTDMYRVIPLLGALLRHTDKCRRGNQCPFPQCQQVQPHLSRNTFRLYWHDEPFLIDMKEIRARYFYRHDHYFKCRDILKDDHEMNDPVRYHYQHGCFCAATRYWAQLVAQELFPPQPLSLELLATCAVPNISPSLFLCHPDTEPVLRLYSMAKRVQKWWRAKLQTRGLYRIKVCKYYKQRGWTGCRKRCDCRYAHGMHDIRAKFVPSLRDLHRAIASNNNNNNNNSR
ncbi:hypothetical protein IV203_015224 [Nitzschia inconspicua]|uniref:C3H1-type domain-containing protein n=1 Tax=Nitzschia inconspicua TaxID=303405 RepID=A0A9K3LBD0_9STRA|nr:hypothetical protein IV203_015224 [Nitzschia inconspicua]